jgi:ankyrin repeat protein
MTIKTYCKIALWTLCIIIPKHVYVVEFSTIHRAIKNNDMHAMKRELTHGVQPDKKAPFNGKTPLHYAARYDRADMANVLISYGADINAKIDRPKILQPKIRPHKRKYTPLHIAAKQDNYNIVRILIHNGAHVEPDIGKREYTPLHIAAYYGYSEITLFLLQRGANPHAIKSKMSVLHFAARSNDLITTKYVLAFGGNTHATNRYHIQPIGITDNDDIYRVLQRTQEQNESLLQHINNQNPQSYIDDGAQMQLFFDRTTDAYKATLLKHFRIYSHLYYSDQIHDVIQQYNVPAAWFFYALKCQHADVLDALCIKKRAVRKLSDMRLGKNNKNLINLAIQYNCISCVKVLFTYFNPMLKYNNGKTAYDVAQEHDRKAIGRMILRWYTINKTLQHAHADDESHENYMYDESVTEESMNTDTAPYNKLSPELIEIITRHTALAEIV